MNPETKNDNNSPKSPKRKKGETLNEKVHRHINDKNDIITDEDIRDAVIEGLTPEQGKENDEIVDEFSKKKKITPWEILDEEE